MKNPSFINGLLVGIGFSVVFFAAYSTFQQAYESAYLSCILSAEEGFTNALSSAESKGRVTLSEEWRRLTDAETAAIGAEFENGPNFYCSRFGDINEGQNDSGQKYGILGRKLDKESKCD